MFIDRYIKKVCSKIRYGSLTLNVKGKSYEFYGELEGPSVHLTISRISMIWDLYFRGSVGLGEAYIKKKFEADDLSKFLEFGALNERAFGNEMSGSKFYRFLSKKYMNKTKNSLFQSKKNIHAHYDLGNDFYLEWLDDTLTYSSGFFKTGLETLSEAQKNKFESLIEGNEPRPGDHVLEIGSGWGSFAFYLISKFPDIKIDTLTISKEQYEFVKTKIREHHLEHKLNVIYKDYREHQGEYSRIYSIEMFEAVGIQYWQTYFEKIKDLLKPSGVFSMQTIVIFEDFFERYTRKIDFIQKYIFPGGMLPSFKILENILSNNSLYIESVNSYANDYAKTLSLWKQEFNKNWENIEKLGFDETFNRMWNYYLSYCEGGFLSKNIDLKQINLKFN